MSGRAEEVEILVVGFGFSAIPLVRELDISGVDYAIVSEKDGSVWAGLERAGALDFDLVSSYYTSFYTFDVVDDFREDRYPTAREFYAMHRRYYEKYKDKIRNDFVTRIENKKGYSIVRTRRGAVYHARDVVISTAFKRKVHESLNNFDFSISNKTVAMNTIGDSANLIIAKLIAGENRIICLQNGFLPLEKLLTIGKTTYSLDQLEAHQLAHHFTRLYRQIFDTNFVRLVRFSPKKPLLSAYARAVDFLQHVLGKMFTPHNFHVPFGWTRRTYVADRRPSAAFPNGGIVVKYWPIDSYEREFGENLGESIEKGYLLNDLPFFASEGLVEFWDKGRTKVDQENKRLECDGEVVEFDFLVEGDSEEPRLPSITYEEDGEVVEYKYKYRNCYLGVIPRELENIYLVGYTRPSSGGLANITEMQCLFVHKLLLDAEFSREMRENLDEKIERYDRRYYFANDATTADHVNIFGFYTEDVAKEMGINLTLKSCRSLRDVGKYFNYPNNVEKYRQKGPYKIEKAADLVDYIYREHRGFKLLWHIGAMYLLYHLLVVGVGGSLYFHGWINGYVFAGLVLAQIVCGYWAMIPIANSTPFFRTKIMLQLFYLPMLLDPRSALMIFPLDFLATYLLRKRPTARYVFNDLKNKKRYRAFFRHYKEVYNRMRRRTDVLPERVAS